MRERFACCGMAMKVGLAIPHSISVSFSFIPSSVFGSAYAVQIRVSRVLSHPFAKPNPTEALQDRLFNTEPNVPCTKYR